MNEDTAATMLPDTPVDPSSEGWEGRVIDGRYRLIEKLGEGGMGAVYVAEHLKLQKLVALKTIHSTLEGHAEITARFAREAMVSARIEHPNVVSALDYGTLEGGGAYLIMQLVRGEGLRARMEREGALPWRKACEIMEQVADAVAAAHAAGIVHRDLKPENVVLEPGDGDAVHVKVLDFGIAHLRADTPQTRTIAPGAPLTQLGVVMGTPGYMAPEQAVGQPVDERTDIYALGVMLWELIAGYAPFQGDTLTEIVTRQFAGQPPALPASVGPVPPALSALIAQMLAPQADGRPARAVDVRDQLRAVLQEQPSSNIAPAALLAKGRAGLSKVLDSAPLAAGRARIQALPGRIKLALAAGLALLGLLLWSVWPTDQAAQTPTASGGKAAQDDRASARARPQAEQPKRTQAAASPSNEGAQPKRTHGAPPRTSEGAAEPEKPKATSNDAAGSRSAASSDGKRTSSRNKGDSGNKKTRERGIDRFKRKVEGLFR